MLYSRCGEKALYRPWKELPKPKALDQIISSKIYKVGKGNMAIQEDVK